MTLTATAALRFFVADRGPSSVETRDDAVPDRRATALQLLAVIGFVHVAALAYDGAMNATVPFADPTEAYPTYFGGPPDPLHGELDAPVKIESSRDPNPRGEAR
jgi:hypothetical protein